MTTDVKRLVLVGTNRHAIAIDDFYMLYRRSHHQIVRIFYPEGTGRHRDWWEVGTRIDPARSNAVDPIDKTSVEITVWNDIDHVIGELETIEFDYVCVGNGNDPAQQRLAEHIGRERMLFSEYGWLPWAECFYISRGGVGTDSDLKTVSRGDLQHVRPRRRELSRLRRAYPRDGSLLPEGEFVYVPLQKDVNDFKFLSSPFANNEEFLGHLHSVIPDELQVLVKPHPLYERTYDLSPFDNFTDISGSDYSKRQLYRRMKAMICINSTSALEALLFERPVIAYGDDIFLNKDLVTYRPADQADMSRALDRPVDRDGCRRFISLLLSRQVNRLRCLADDHRYVESHHWVTSI